MTASLADTTARPTTMTRVISLCLRHLEQEEALLGATLASVRLVRAALTGGDQHALRQALDTQQHLEGERGHLRQTRLAFQREVGAALGLALEEVTLRHLATRLPGDAGARLARGHGRLSRMLEEIERLNRQNATVLSGSIDFLERFFSDLTGGGPAAGCYGPAGTRQPEARGSILEARG